MALAALTPPMPRWQDRVLGPDRRQGPGAPQRFFFSPTLSLAGSRFLWASVSVPRAHSRTRDAVGGARGARDNASLSPQKGSAGPRAAAPSRGRRWSPGPVPPIPRIQRLHPCDGEGLRVNCTGEEVDGAYWISRSVSAVAIGPRRGANKTFCHLPSDLLPSPHHTPLPSLLSLPLFVHSSSHSPMPTPVAVRPHVRTTF